MASQDDYENLATLLKPFHDRAKLAEVVMNHKAYDQLRLLHSVDGSLHIDVMTGGQGGKTITSRNSIVPEERLEKLEAALEAQKGPAPRVDRGIVDKLIELKSTLEVSRAEQLAEREKAAKEFATLSVEKEKLQYQVVHLKRSLEEADKKLLQYTPSSK